MSIASLVLGIIGIVSALTVVAAPIGWILVTIGLIIGIVDVVKKGKIGEKRGIGTAGIAICTFTFVVLMIGSMIIGYGLMINRKMYEIPESEKVNSMYFDDRYEAYKGVVTGSQAKMLLSLTKGDNNIISCKFNDDIEEVQTIISKIKASSSYNMDFEYNYDGHIKTIKITEINKK